MSLVQAWRVGAPEGGACVLLIGPQHQPWAWQMFAEQGLGGTRGWVDSGQVCFFLVIGGVSWYQELEEAESV